MATTGSDSRDRDIRLTIPDRRGTGAFKWDLAAPDEIPMWVADMDYAVSPAIINALRDRLGHPVFGYTAIPDSFYSACISWYQRRHGWSIDRDAFVAVPSVMAAIAVAIESMTQPGDTIALASPIYPPFYTVIEELGRRVVDVPLGIEITGDRPRHRLDIGALASALDDSAAFLLCSPHNPGGRVWRRDELEALSEIADGTRTPIISDEIHADLAYPGETFVPWATVQTDGISLVSPSKTFNIPGLPLALAVISDRGVRERFERAVAARKLEMANLLAVTAAEAAYTGADDWVDEVRRAIAAAYSVLADAFAAERGVCPYRQDGTYIVWVDCRERWRNRDSRESASRAFVDVAREHGVWVSPGRDFGIAGEGHIRINVATSKELLEEGLRRVRRALTDFDRR
jgi:cystathionine beta-lyase